MKIVHIEDFFHPDAGYQVNILTKYQSNAGDEVIIVCASMEDIPNRLKGFFGAADIQNRDNQFELKYNVKIIRMKTFGYYSGRAIYKFNFLAFIRNLKPDLLYVHGNDSFAGLIITLFARCFSFPVIFDNHMLEMATKNRFNKLFRLFYRFIFAPIIRKRGIYVIRLVDSDFILKWHGIPAEQSPIIPFGTDSILFQPNKEKRRAFRNEHNINDDSFVVLYMGKLTADKGVLLLAEAMLEKFEIDREVVLVIVGNSSSDYGKLVLDKLVKSENRVLVFPTQTYESLAMFYQMADLSVFPKHCSLSFFDAQSTGLPAVLEVNEINTQRLMYNNGALFKPGNSRDLRVKILSLASLDNKSYNLYRQNAINFIVKNSLDFNFIFNNYKKVFEKALKNFQSR